MKNFTDKVVVITGAASGMGREYALEFARLGALVAITDVNAEQLAETHNMVKAITRKNSLSEVLDIAAEESVTDFAGKVKRELGNAHIIINNAGIGGGGAPVWVQDNGQYHTTMQVNFFAVVYITKAFLPQLLANQEGAVVNVSSVFGLLGTPGTSDYCASKFAVRGFTESLMVELADTPISVHLVHPGGIKTNIAKHSKNGAEFEEKYLKTDPLFAVREVIKGIQSGKQRMIFGYQSSLLRFLTLLPLKLRNRILHREMGDMRDPEHYAVLEQYSTSSSRS
ncbi:SDR family NAD(P)-dependent oxidoreductase [Thalassolituus alkanivorans]|uniref:SDR family NAD(P)-dependent oxidoreductase n=1 Tax=Thalassolituus alkanivorans TaxID=2881055 RepID=UPI001E31D371|nr:SDR family oxidoreductase [Thalassolituus alkanivorans]MCB2386798.1 SDR family oxidoreductase [Thalassolituus alkanivorans]MCB2424519.1 SDR family oxidoreductase [Thalassolituus alkanivorans]